MSKMKTSKKITSLTLTGIAVAFAAFVASDSGGENSLSRTASCTTLCDREDPSCFLVNYRGADSDGAMDLLREEFLHPLPLTLQPSRIAQIFSMQDKLATMKTRAPIEVNEKGEFTNVGEPRTVTIRRPGVELSVHFPRTLEARLWKSGDEIEFAFEESRNALSVAFENSVISARFGGTVERIHASPTQAIFEMPAGCTQIPFSDALLTSKVTRTAGTALLLFQDATSGLLEPFTRDEEGDETCNPPGPQCLAH